MNGMRLPGLRPEFFDAAIAWELKRVDDAAARGAPERPLQASGSAAGLPDRLAR